MNAFRSMIAGVLASALCSTGCHSTADGSDAKATGPAFLCERIKAGEDPAGPRRDAEALRGLVNEFNALRDDDPSLPRASARLTLAITAFTLAHPEAMAREFSADPRFQAALQSSRARVRKTADLYARKLRGVRDAGKSRAAQLDLYGEMGLTPAEAAEAVAFLSVLREKTMAGFTLGPANGLDAETYRKCRANAPALLVLDFTDAAFREFYERQVKLPIDSHPARLDMLDAHPARLKKPDTSAPPPHSPADPNDNCESCG